MLAAARPRVLTTWQQAAIWAWAAISLAVIFVRGHALGLDAYQSNRIREHVLPVAVSVLYHGRQHDYTAFDSVAAAMAGGRTIDAARRLVVPPNDGTYYWVADDRGMADYAIGALFLFGPRLQSLYYFFFVILGVSAALFLADLGRHPAPAALALFTLGGLYVCLSVIPLGNLTLQVFEAGSLFEPRVFELLSLVAALHLGLTAWFDDPWTWKRRALVGAQAAILVACFHARSSIAWEVLFVLCSNNLALAVRVIRRDRTVAVNGALVGIVWPCLVTVVLLVVVTGYQRVALNPKYRTLGGRTIWHNVLMGLSSNASLQKKYDLAVSDPAVVSAVINFYWSSPHPKTPPQWLRTDLLGSLGGHGETNWFEYEDTARRFYASIWRAQPAAVIHCYLIDKPREIARIFFRSTRPREGAVSGRPGASVAGLGFFPFSLVALALVAPAFALAYTRPDGWWQLAGLTGLMLLCSLIPGFAFYPVVHTMMGAFVMMTVVAYTVIGGAVSAARNVAA
jgi:hypothetical protein